LNQSALVRGGATGFLVSSNGCVVTNRHVVAQAQILGEETSQFGIQLLNGTTIPATLIKVANESGPDLAVLMAKGSSFNALTIDPTVPSQGAAIFTVGNPSRFGTWVTSTGTFAMVGQDPFWNGSVLKFSLPGGPGASGSPMLNMNGIVVGVLWGVTQTNNTIGPSDSLVIWLDNAGQYDVRNSYANAVPSQALTVFLKDTPCQVTVGQSAAGQASQGLLPLLVPYLQYATVVLLLFASCAATIDGLRRFGNRGQR
jgi:S1-C subfamily serine protease